VVSGAVSREAQEITLANSKGSQGRTLSKVEKSHSSRKAPHLGGSCECGGDTG
jgi:hypothetical protein